MKNFFFNIFNIFKNLSLIEKLVFFILVLTSLLLVLLEMITFSAIYNLFSDDFWFEDSHPLGATSIKFETSQPFS